MEICYGNVAGTRRWWGDGRSYSLNSVDPVRCFPPSSCACMSQPLRSRVFGEASQARVSQHEGERQPEMWRKRPFGVFRDRLVAFPSALSLVLSLCSVHSRRKRREDHILHAIARIVTSRSILTISKINRRSMGFSTVPREMLIRQNAAAPAGQAAISHVAPSILLQTMQWSHESNMRVSWCVHSPSFRNLENL